MTTNPADRHVARVSAHLLAALGGACFCTVASAQLVDVTGWMNSPHHFAQKLQWKLSQGMPLDQNFMLVTHNSYNSSAYGGAYPAAQQHSYTLTQQLNLGIRGFDLDIHERPNGGLYLSHATCEGFGWLASNRTLDMALAEFAAWLSLPQNADEVIVVYLENWIDTNQGRNNAWSLLGGYPGFGSRVVRYGDLGFQDGEDACDFSKIRPQSIRAAGKNIIVVDIGGSGNCTVDLAAFGSGFVQSTIDTAPTNRILVPLEPDLFNLGDRVAVRGCLGTVVNVNVPARPNAIEVDWARDIPNVQGNDALTNYNAPNPVSQNFIFANFNGGADTCGSTPVWTYVHARDFDGDPSDPSDRDSNGQDDAFDPDLNADGVPDFIQMQYWDFDPIGSRFAGVAKKNFLAVTYGNSSATQYQHYGKVTPAIMRESARAGMDQVRLDPLGVSWATGVRIEGEDLGNLTSSVWAWDIQFLPSRATPRPAQAAVAAIYCESSAIGAASARFRATSPDDIRRYAEQDDAGEWHITDRAGRFADHQASTGRTFTVPGNPYEMQNLFGAMVRAGAASVWVNYADLNQDGVWEAQTKPRRFYSPSFVADAPARRSPLPCIVSNAIELQFAQTVTASYAGQSFGTTILLNNAPYPGARRFNAPTILCPAAPGVTASIGR